MTVESMQAEIEEAIDLQLAHFPHDKKMTLRHRAEKYRADRYEKGCWTDFAEVAKKEK
jgi:hypothetical protein